VLGEIELHRGNAEAARKQYEMGLKESPNHLLVLEHFAELEQLEGNLRRAEDLNRRILAQREDPKAELRLAALLSLRGEYRESARLRSAAFLFYQHAVASGNEGYLRPLAVFELAHGHYARAEKLQSRDVALRPNAESRAILQFIQDTAAAKRTQPTARQIR
jgi:tetratricopeptide (TPR) repeat protein